MKVRHEVQRRIEFIHPVAATDAIFRAERELIERDVFWTSPYGGPVEGRPDLYKRIILVREPGGEDYLKTVKAAIKPFAPRGIYTGVRFR